MAAFIFLTGEGYTFQPDSESVLPDVENIQVIGFANGENAESAFNQLLLDEPWLRQTSFRETQCIELAHLDYRSKVTTFRISRAKNEPEK